MSNIDKLKSAAAKAVDNFDPNMFVETRDVLALLDENDNLLREKDAMEAAALAMRDDMRLAREKLEAAEKRNAEQADTIAKQEKWIKDVEATMIAATDRAEAAEKRIAELERDETQLIEERDSAEKALADMYEAAMGERPEWSNLFGYAEAIDDVAQHINFLDLAAVTGKGE